jgi:hypothetical protein
MVYYVHEEVKTSNCKTNTMLLGVEGDTFCLINHTLFWQKSMYKTGNYDQYRQRNSMKM